MLRPLLMNRLGLALVVVIAVGRCGPADEGSTGANEMCDPANAAQSAELMVQASVPTYEISMAQESLDKLYADPWSGKYRDAQVTIGGETFADATVRFRGHSARNFDKKSWKVKFAKDNQFNDPDWGYSRKVINLNAEYTDPTLMREKLSYDLMAELGMMAPRARFARLVVNDEYQGLFVDVENPRSDFFEHHGLNDKGGLYQAYESQLKPLSSVADYDGPFEKKLQEDEPWDDLDKLAHDLADLPGAQAYQALGELVDEETMARFMVANVLINQTDHLHKNYLLYHDHLSTGKWFVVPWDHDLTWGRVYDRKVGGIEGFFVLNLITDTGIDFGSYSGSEGNDNWGNVLYDRYLNSPEYFADFRTRICSALDQQFTGARVIARIDYYETLIRDAVLADPQKWGANEDWAVRVEELRQFALLRRAHLLSEVRD